MAIVLNCDVKYKFLEWYSLLNYRDKTDITSSAASNVKKVGRNEPCPRGSGKKYRKCCGRRRRNSLLQWEDSPDASGRGRLQRYDSHTSDRSTVY